MNQPNPNKQPIVQSTLEQTPNEEVDTVLGRFTLFVKDLSNGLNGSQEVPPSQESVSEEAEVISRKIIVLGQTFDNFDNANDYIESKLWLSYRCGFEPIPKSIDGPQPIQFFPSIIFNRSTIYSNFANLKSLFDKENFTSDAGWGCMIRTSQNLLANTLLKLYPKNEPEIVKLFQDGTSSPFSIHNFIRVASLLPLHVKPGEWFGPNAASLSIKRLASELLQDQEIDGIKIPRVFISENSDLFDDEIRDVFAKEKNASVLILFPIRLGIDKVNSYYYNSIFHLLASKYSCGIAGGKPSSSFYFLGYEDTDLIYFDPHLPQVVETPINMDSYHTTNYNRLNISLLDPSMMIGILVTNIDEYIDFKTSCLDINNKIVHFHPHTLPVQQDSIINQSWEEVQDEEEEFINLNVSKIENEQQQEQGQLTDAPDEFIDIGNQLLLVVLVPSNV